MPIDGKKQRALRAAQVFSKNTAMRTAGINKSRNFRKRFSNNIVPKAKGSELKQTEIVLNTTTTASTMQITPISVLAQGDDYNNRTGRSIEPVSLRIRGTIVSSASVNNQRVLVIMDRGTGSLPTEAEIIRTAGLSGSAINLDNSDRFTIIKDDFFTAGTNSNDLINHIDWYLPFPKGIECKYTGTAANQGSLGSNAIYFCILTGGTSTGVPTLRVDFRFKDA